eukprot:1176839-Prorocentrum_minimum.AAC.1
MLEFQYTSPRWQSMIAEVATNDWATAHHAAVDLADIGSKGSGGLDLRVQAAALAFDPLGPIKAFQGIRSGCNVLCRP